ncbi:MAG TPA: hypothetical protein VG320_30695 [Paraburkholderia sp.]|uniref:hypothetical protein n=1 Tax=Paraburkholderia sp. TaxID=1926495 RepID=UPI002DF0E035|nr:hypothetical protein [Paraburkholderia sp.]
MSISVQDLLSLAHALGNGAGESEWRSGASRAYYAAYHRALEVADACLPTNLFAAGEHERLTERFKQHSMKGKQIAYVLIDLKKTRTTADYKLTAAFQQADATDFIPKCEVFLEKVDEFHSQISGTQATGL